MKCGKHASCSAVMHVFSRDELELSPDDRRILTSMVRSPTFGAGLVRRARVIRDGDGDWTLTRRGTDEDLQLTIVRWSSRPERVLGESEIPHSIQGGSWEDCVAVLPKLVQLAPRLRSLITSKPRSETWCTSASSSVWKS